MFLLFSQPPLKKCSKKKCSNMHTRASKYRWWRRTGPALVPKPQAAQPPVKASIVCPRPARAERVTPFSAAGERRGGRPEGRCPPTFSPGLTSRLRARILVEADEVEHVFCRCRCRLLQWPQGNWCCVAAPRPNLKSDQGSRAGPPWRRTKSRDAGGTRLDVDQCCAQKTPRRYFTYEPCGGSPSRLIGAGG